jgi:hypothetical protein
MKRVIGWRLLKGMKKQHLAFYTYDGDARLHCLTSHPDQIAVDGRSINTIKKSYLLTNHCLPKCKKCIKEEKRVKGIESQND